VIRRGSDLCHASYCDRYRVAARSDNTVDSSAGHRTSPERLKGLRHRTAASLTDRVCPLSHV